MIKVKEISKSFGEIKALKQISFEIKVGEIFGFLGPNGAGKTTTINILNTLLLPNTGEVFIDGLDLKNNIKKCKIKIGVVPQEIALYENLSGMENLLFWGSLYNIPKSELKIKADKAIKMVGLSDRKNHSVKTYSGGMKRRINIASSILHNPKILLMDEPTVGVDPQSRNHIFEIIEQLNNEGITIIYTTHYMEEAERLCDTIAIIDNGTIVAKGNLGELKTLSQAKDLLTIKISGNTDKTLTQIKKVFPIRINGAPDVLEVECTNIGNEISGIISTIQKAGAVIERIDTHEANLESVFLKLTGKQLRD